MTEMTEKQAKDAVVKKLAPMFKAMAQSRDQHNKYMPRLAKYNDELDAALKKGESATEVQLLMPALEQAMREEAKALAPLSQSLRIVADTLKGDPEIARAIGPDYLDEVRHGAAAEDKARNALRRAKQLLEQGEAFLARQSKDEDAAAEEWSATLARFDAAYAGCQDEARAATAWQEAAAAALAARDKVKLDKIVKAVPACRSMDEMAALPKGRPFDAFDRRYEVDSLSSDLQDEISMDRGKAMNQYDKAIKLIEARTATVQRVQAMKIEARDGLKALKVLALPKTALTRLQAAIDGPDGLQVKALDTLSRAFKASMDGKAMQLALQKASVL